MEQGLKSRKCDPPGPCSSPAGCVLPPPALLPRSCSPSCVALHPSVTNIQESSVQSLGPSGPLKAPRGPLLPQAEPRPPGFACTEAAFLNGPPSAPAAPAPFLPPPAPQAKLWDWPALKTPPRGHTNSHCCSWSSCSERTKEGARVRPGGGNDCPARREPEDRGTTPAGACPHSWARWALHRRGRRRAESAVSHGGSRRGRTKCDKHWGDGLETSRGGHRPLSRGCVPGW